MTRRGCLPRLRSRSKGAAAVEFALILPLLLLLVLGAIDWGYYFFIDNIVVNAAREGARAGSVTATGSGNQSTALSNAETVANGYLTRFGLSGICSGSCATVVTVSGVSAIQVEISYPVGNSGSGSLTGFLASIMPDNAWARAAMRWQ